MSEVSDYEVTEFTAGETAPDEWIRENYDALRAEAESDAPDAWVFQQLIGSVEHND